MIIETIKGDLIQLYKDGKNVAHGCNCHHAMASGVAGQFSKECPEVPLADERHHTLGSADAAGGYSIARNDKGGRCYNLYTQYYPGANAKYYMIAEAFSHLNEKYRIFDKNNPKPLYIPKIGAGVGGLEWHKVKTIIDIVTPDIPIILVEWNPAKSVVSSNAGPLDFDDAYAEEQLLLEELYV